MLASKGKRGTMSCKMKRAISLMAAMLAAALLPAGCQPTPEQPIVMQRIWSRCWKGAGYPIPRRRTDPCRTIRHPGAADRRMERGGREAVHPHRRAHHRPRACHAHRQSTGRGLSQETATALFHHFMDGKTAMTYNPGPHVMTKADIEATICSTNSRLPTAP